MDLPGPECSEKQTLVPRSSPTTQSLSGAMTPKTKEPPSDGEVEDDSCTRRKRSRRVSFAETTVHVYKRDEESESPANSTPILSDGCQYSDEETVDFQGLHSQGDDSMDSSGEEEDEDGMRRRFVRTMDSSSPGSAVCSVTSNDDDNFFGPVSTSFIDSGHLSESGMSDDNNHDITLDSTAFSMHFRNIAPPTDHSANSTGSLRTPSDTFPKISMGFLVERDQIEVLTSTSSVGQAGNISEDSHKISPIVGGSHIYDHEKLSETLDAFLNKVNLSMQHNSQSGDHNTCNSQTDEVGDIKEFEKDKTEIVNQSSFYDDPALFLHCTFSRMGKSTSNGSLLNAKVNALTSHSNGGKKQEIFSPSAADRHVEAGEAIHPESLIAHGQISVVLSPSPRELENCLNVQSHKVHQELSRSITEAKTYPDSSLHSISTILSVPEDVSQKLETVNITHTPKSITKSFHFSTPDEKMSSQNQEQQHLLIPTSPSSSKIVSISTGEISSPTKTPDNADKAFQLSSLQGSISSFQSKKGQLLDISDLSQSELMHNSATEQSASMNWELMEHGEKNSVIQNHLIRSKVKSRLQSDYLATPSRKDPVFTLQHTTNSTGDDTIRKFDSTSNVGFDANKVTTSKIIKDLEYFGNVNCLMELDKNAVLENIDISMQTPDNAVKILQHSTLKGSISSFQAKHRQLQYSSILSLKKSMHTSARELSASRNMEFIKHGQRLSFIKSSISKFKSVPKTDCEAASSKKDLFITDFQASLDENSNSCMKDAVISDVNNTGKLDADKQMEGLTVFDKNVSYVGTVQNGQSKGMKFDCDSSVELLHSLDTRASSIDQRAADLNESKQELNSSCKYAPVKENESAISSEGCITPGGDEMNNSSYILHKNFQPAISLVCPSEKKSQNSLSYHHGLRHQNSDSQQETCYACTINAVEVRKELTCNEEAFDIVAKTPQKCLADVISNLSDTTNQLLPQSISEQNLPKLDDLEGLLDELQKAKKYEELFITLKTHNHFINLRQKRVTHARSLLEKLRFAKARKQLKCIRLNKMQDKALFLHSKIEEYDKLKSSYAQLFDLNAGAVELDEASNCKHQNEDDKLLAMKQELGILEHNINFFVKSFEVSWKLTSKMSCNELIKTIDEHVMRRTLCKDIQQHLQLWKLNDVVTRNDHYEVILSYCDLLFQRFTISKNRFSSILENNVCNVANIVKKFPNMDAGVAFEFVFKLTGDHKLANANFIQERTVETNLLMGTLIDVLEEILLSRLELWNLVSSTFRMLSSGELELQLYFYSSTCARKLVLGLDMTNLNCGVYPASPTELKIQVEKQQTTFPPAMVNAAVRAVRGLESGPLFIHRLCRIISQFLQSASIADL